MQMLQYKIPFTNTPFLTEMCVTTNKHPANYSLIHEFLSNWNVLSNDVWMNTHFTPNMQICDTAPQRFFWKKVQTTTECGTECKVRQIGTPCKWNNYQLLIKIATWMYVPMSSIPFQSEAIPESAYIYTLIPQTLPITMHEKIKSLVTQTYGPGVVVVGSIFRPHPQPRQHWPGSIPRSRKVLRTQQAVENPWKYTNGLNRVQKVHSNRESQLQQWGFCPRFLLLKPNPQLIFTFIYNSLLYAFLC